MKYISLENVKENMILAKYICDENGNLLFLGNQKLTRQIIDYLRNNQIYGVYIYSDMMNQLEQNLYKSTELVNQLLKTDNAQLLYYFKKYHKETYKHSIHVAILSVIIGFEMNLSSKELYNLGLAALLHDIGKLKIPIKILNKAGKLTSDEYTEMKNHPMLGYELLVDKNLDKSILKAILQHHEKEDGSGYPYHLKGNQICDFAKIIHLADVYDALTNKRCYKDKIKNSDVLNFINSEMNKSFDERIVEYFSHIPTKIII